jgi:hypothetical protein
MGTAAPGCERRVGFDADPRMVNLKAADLADSVGAQAILDAIRKCWPWIKHFFADGAYDRRKLMDTVIFTDFVTNVVRRIDNDPGFKIPLRRWVVARTFARITRYRRLASRYEQRICVSQPMIRFVSVGLLLRRAAQQRQLQNGHSYQSLRPRRSWADGAYSDSPTGARKGAPKSHSFGSSAFDLRRW